MISKTNYVTFKSCPRCYYYILNNKDQAKELDDNSKKRIDDGFKVNDFAYKLFPNIAFVKKDFKEVNEKLQVEITKELLNKNTKYIAEASFIYEDLFCAVDILVKDGNSYDIYEVKATNDIDDKMDRFGPDVAFQKYVLEKCGLTINHCYIIHLNKEFIKHGDIKVDELLKIECIDDNAQFIKEYEDVDATLKQMRHMDKNLPTYGTCKKDCLFFNFCHKDLAIPNVLELNRLSLKKAHDLIRNGIKSFDDLAKSNTKLSKFQQVQLQTYLKKQNNFDKEEIQSFLNILKYPIYHLDFETMNEAIPLVDGTSPYQQVPFQYSLHIEHKDGHLDHKEFLGEKLDCQYELAKQLISDIKPNGTPMAYNMSFERGVIKKLAERFPEFEQQLMVIHKSMVDLLEPFRHAGYYNPIQHGSNSIKQVMPAIVPEMANDYKQLTVVHNGGEALALFPKLVTKIKGDEYKTKRKGLLEYCKLDTLSMVKVLEKLKKMCE